MSHPSLRSVLHRILTKELLLALEDGVRAEALRAHHVIRDHTGLKDARRARGAEGQIRFRMMEERFEEVCQFHGGRLLEGGVIPSSDLRVFQPFCRFEIEGQGLIFGLAAMSEPKVLPTKNKSRLAGAAVNCQLIPSLFEESGPRVGDVFVLLLVCRDRDRAGLIEEIAIGVVDSRYETFLLYEDLGRYLSGSEMVPAPPSSPHAPPAKPVVLKKTITPFTPPEAAPAKTRASGTE